MSNKINRGSEWRKWDLHFHTPSSYDYKDKSVSNEQIIDGLAQNGISVIAITDHHVIDVERIKKLQSLGKEKNITVLPGIEFLSDARGEEPIHFIGIFSEKSKIDYIWKQIESRTNIRKIEGENKKHNEVYCDLIETIDLIKELGGIVSIHAGEKTHGIENITHSLPHSAAQKDDIAKAIDIFEIGKEKDLDGYLKHVIPYCIKKINKNIPIIICSDNHNINEYKIKQNLWIKADPTFEGLKQIIYEPERAKIQKEKPDYKEDKVVIDYVRYINAKDKFTNQIIYFNPNLNVIIGGKSSGKSILLYNIAKTLYPEGTFFKDDEQQDVYKEVCKNEISDFDFEVTIKGGFSQRMYEYQEGNSILPDIKYIPQNYLIKLAEPEIHKKSKDILDLVRSLIKEDKESEVIYENFIKQLKENDKKREDLIENYFTIKEYIHYLHDQLKQKRKKEILNKNIETNLEKIEEHNKNIGLTEDQREQYKITQEKLNFLNEYLENLINDKENVIKYHQRNDEILHNIKLNYEQFITSLTVENFKNALIDKKESIEKFINDIESNFKSATNNEDFLSKEIEATQNQISDYKVLISNFLEKENIQNLIKGIEDSISEDRRELNEIQKLNKEIEANALELINAKNRLLDFYEENYLEYPKVLKQLQSRVDTLNEDSELIIKGITRFNYRKFRKAIVDISDGRSNSYFNYPELFDKNLSALTEYTIESLKNSIEKVFDNLIEGKYILLPSKEDIKQATKILFGHYFFDDWEVEYLGDKLKHMSSGKASFVILMLIIGLSKSKTPILIDQPEDNLDNRSISTELVKYLKKKKIERQIILVTHNANIVVNADAENIIVAHQKGQTDNETSSPYRFDYTNGSLENTSPKNKDEKDLLKSMGIREHITDIVEGTEIAFKKRQEKYGF